MVHIKWLMALVLTTALSVAATFYATERYIRERTMWHIAEIAMMRNTTYVILVKAIEDGKYDEAKTRLRKMFDMEVKQIQQAKSELENGWFASANDEYIDRLNRYLAPPAAGTAK